MNAGISPPGPVLVLVWANPRLDRQFTLPAAQVAGWFCDSPWAKEWWRSANRSQGLLEHAIARFVTDPGGPVNAVCDSASDRYTYLKKLIVNQLIGLRRSRKFTVQK